LAGTLNSTFARLETAFAQQSQFTSDAAHELRTPVSIILTQTQSTLNKERSAAEYRETLEVCQRAAQRMRRLTESLLQLARMDAGQEAFRRETFDLAVIARNSVELLRPLAIEKCVTIRADVAEAKCVGDSDRIAQVITNLLNNAINYNKPGGEIRLGVAMENDSVVLTVADTGVGISREDLPRVFERFYRGDKSRTGSGNAGLGLAICHAIVAAHGGEMAVSSELGQGTTFTLRLPAARG
jgi:signal transduction histidine kinase